MPLDSRVKHENEKADTMPLDITKRNKDTCASIPCHSRATTRESRNDDVKFMNKDIYK